MAIKLEKGQRINLEKSNGSKTSNFCVGCNWGAIVKKKFLGLSSCVVDVDLDLSCLLFDLEGKPVDHIYSYSSLRDVYWGWYSYADMMDQSSDSWCIPYRISIGWGDLYVSITNISSIHR